MPASPTHFDGTDFLVDPLDLGADTERPHTTNLVALYRRAIDGCAKVSPERAATLFEQVRGGDWRGDLEIEANALSARARAELIFSLLPLGFWFARKFPTVPVLDVIAICNLAAIKAVDRLTVVFDPTRGQLSSYAVQAMHGRLMTAFQRQRSMLSIPGYWFEAESSVRKARVALEAKGEAPTRERLAKATSLPLSTIDTVNAVRFPDIGLSDFLSSDSAEPMSYEEVIADPNAIDPEHLYAKEEGSDVVRQLLQQHLTARQFEVVELLYLADVTMTAAAVAVHLQITPFAVEALWQAAREKLQKIQGLRPLLRALSAPTRAYGRSNLTAQPVRLHDKRAARAKTTKPRLTPDQVRHIRRLAAEGVLQAQIAKEFFITPSAVFRIVQGTRSQRIQ